MNLKNKTIRRNNTIPFKIIDSKVLILDQDNSKLRELNETASMIWMLIEQPKTVEFLVKEILKEYDVKEIDVLTDIENFVNLYQEKQLIVIEGDVK